MATEFKILRGNKGNLIDDQGNSRLPEEKLVNGYWYLTNDTAEVYVCLEVDGHLQLKKINECDVNNDFSDLESFEQRLAALEAEEVVETYGYKSAFPTTGEAGHMYIAVDEQKTYIWYDNNYLPVGGSSEEYDIIFGGTAD